MRVGLGARGRPHDVTIAFAAMSVIVLGVARFWDFQRAPLVVCPLRRYAHLPCPACGMTRAFVRTVHGDFAGALRVSPLGTALCVVAIALVSYAVLRVTVLRRGVTIALGPRESLTARIGLVAAVAANWLYLLVSGAATSD